jgi:F-type H+-transporting ATPase subunit b
MKILRHFLFVLPLAAAVPAFAEEDVGFPQLKQADTYPSQVFWLAVSFVVLYVLMSTLALPRVASVIETRRKNREDNLKEAESLNAEAEKIRKAFESSLAKAQGAAQDVMRSTEQGIADRIAEENARFAEAARKRLVSAEQNIAQAKQDAMTSLADISAEIAAEMSGKIAGVQVSKADAKIAVAGLMKG